MELGGLTIDAENRSKRTYLKMGTHCPHTKAVYCIVLTTEPKCLSEQGRKHFFH